MQRSSLSNYAQVLVLVLLALSIAIPPANAQATFALDSFDEYDVCSDQTTLIEALLVNEGNNIANFQVIVEGDIVNPINAVVAVSEHTATPIPLTVTPRDKLDHQILITTVSLEQDLVAQKLITVHSKDCSVIQIIPRVQNPETLACNNYAIPVDLTNKEFVERTYDISLLAPPWAIVDIASITLGPGETGVLEIKMQIPCSIEGKQYFRLNARIADTSLEQHIILPIKVFESDEEDKLGLPFYKKPGFVIPLFTIIVILLFYALTTGVQSFISWKKKRKDTKLQRQLKKRQRIVDLGPEKLALLDQRKTRVWQTVFGVIILGAIIALDIIFWQYVAPFIAIEIGVIALVALIIALTLRTKRRSHQRFETKKRTNPLMWKIPVFLVVAAIIVVGLFFVSGINKGGAITPTGISIDDSEIKVKDGKVYSNGKDITIPIVIGKDYKGANFKIESNIPWLNIDDSELTSNNVEKRIYITTSMDDEIRKQNFYVVLGLSATIDGKIINEKIEFSLINNEPFFGSQTSFILLGIVFGILLILISLVTKKIRAKRRKGNITKKEIESGWTKLKRGKVQLKKK